MAKRMGVKQHGSVTINLLQIAVMGITTAGICVSPNTTAFLIQRHLIRGSFAHRRPDGYCNATQSPLFKAGLKRLGRVASVVFCPRHFLDAQ